MLRPDLLSALAEQLRAVQLALRERMNSFSLEGRTVRLARTIALHATVTRSGESDCALKLSSALFRPFAMPRPDMAPLAEAALAAGGFGAARRLGAKLAVFLPLAQVQLTATHLPLGIGDVREVGA